MPLLSAFTSRIALLAALVSLFFPFDWERASAQQPAALRLPAGNAEAGKQAFLDLKCIHCHGVKGVALEHPELHKRLTLNLADSSRFVVDHASLLTAITNPRHVIQERYSALLSPLEQAETEPFMPDLTRAMTVRQLLDLVAFLEEIYETQLPSFKSTR